MTAFPALVLAIALTYAFGDVYRPFLPKLMSYCLDLLLCVVIFRTTHRYLQKLKD